MGAKIILILIGLLAGMIFPTHASAFAATETTDFGNTNTSSTGLGGFQVGINTVSGSVDRQADSTGGTFNAGDLYDFWDAGLSSGMQITDIYLKITNLEGSAAINYPSAHISDGIISLADSSVSVYFSQWFTSNGTYSFPSSSAAFTVSHKGVFGYPLGAGRYYFAAGTDGGSAHKYDYEWSISVESTSSRTVPEPSTVFLLGSGLAGLALYRRRRKQT